MKIDLNCDMGESFGVYTMGDDAAMLEIVTTANIACGFHAGDPLVMHKTIKAAKENDVAVGAHPSFLDLWGFGRRPIQGESPADVEKHLIYQIGALSAMANALEWPIVHVKTHGALGNMAAVDIDLALACTNAVKAVDPSLIYLTLPYSETFNAAEKAGLKIACEVFADRTYADDGTLTPRKQPGAVIHDKDVATERVLRMVLDHEVISTGGNRLPVKPDSVCVHGDTPGSVEMANTIRSALTAEGVTVERFDRSEPETA